MTMDNKYLILKLIGESQNKSLSRDALLKRGYGNFDAGIFDKAISELESGNWVAYNHTIKEYYLINQQRQDKMGYNEDVKQVLVLELQEERNRMIDYVKLKVNKEDWHGVADAAMDLREIDAKLSIISKKE